MIVLDTNVVSEVMRREPSQRVLQWLRDNESNLALPTITIAELAFGIERIRPHDRPERWGNALASIRKKLIDRILPFDEMSALIYGEVNGLAARSGNTQSVSDGMIAAIALRHNASLATRNLSHFLHVGLKLINPWD